MVYKKGMYWIFHNQSVDIDYSYKNHIQMAWYVVRYSHAKIGRDEKETNKFYVNEGDIIKFGRVRFKVRQLKIKDDEFEVSSESNYYNYGRERLNDPGATVEDQLNQ